MRDVMLKGALHEQLAKLDAKITAARGRGSRSMVLDVSEAQFLLGLANILVQDVFSKPDGGGEQVGRSASASSTGTLTPPPCAPAPAAAGEETVAIADAFGGRAGR
jgi:hypothetical protein